MPVFSREHNALILSTRIFFIGVNREPPNNRKECWFQPGWTPKSAGSTLLNIQISSRSWVC